MEQCIRDQQSVTHLLYLDDICICAPDVDVMLDQIEMIFAWLENFLLKIKPRKCHFFTQALDFKIMSFLWLVC